MKTEQYNAMLGWFRARPAARRALRIASTGAVAAVYVLYAGLLSWLFWQSSPLLPGEVLVPAVVFVAGSVLRKAINRPRPYETLGFAPLFLKDTRGQSFPSRHCFSAACIAVAAWFACPPLAAVLGVLGCVLAVSRVLSGVHYPSDVLAGLAFGAAASGLGFAVFFAIC